MSISKTDFIRGMQCPKMLWLDAHRPELKVIPEETQKRLDRGNEFGDKAMAMFGPFEEMTAFIPGTKYLDKKKMVQNTRNAMRSGVENICEASFDHDGEFCAVDILHRVEDDVWELYEVKDSPEVRQELIEDAAYQAWVLNRCGIKLDGVFVVYHYDDEDDPFEPVDVTEEAIEFARVVDENIDRLKAVKDSKAEIMQKMGEQCSKPYGCWYCEYCEALARQSSLFD
ncbi:MAG: Dna2/Cas4 domain-containing protein [Oscillospiraceae bacterium]|nr:Dna2/Cas4 domain-containing protein [Oscillospiraceae bacterium]